MKSRTTLIIMLFSILLVSCTAGDNEFIEEDNSASLIIGTIDDQTTGGAECSDITCLIAGQNITIGDVYYVADGTTVTICYEITEPGWTIDLTHLWIGNCDDRPANNPGNPLIGHFPYSESHPGATQYCYTIDQDPNWDPTDVCIAAHAEATGPTEETAWACGEPYGGNSWATIFRINLEDCPAPPN